MKKSQSGRPTPKLTTKWNKEGKPEQPPHTIPHSLSLYSLSSLSQYLYAPFTLSATLFLSQSLSIFIFFSPIPFLFFSAAMMPTDDWFTSAMADDTVVAELLLRLKQSQAASPSISPLSMTVLPFTWGIRQPRSRMPTPTPPTVRCSGSGGDAVLLRNNKDVDSTRCSPTTPLSWSGGASPSAATLDGYEDSSRPAASLSFSHAASRFKGASANEAAAGTAAKRLRRKKTFAELKEEENMLLNEKLHLKKELASLQATFEEQRAKNESLKKMKVDFNLKYTEKFSTNSNMIIMPEESSSTLTHQMESLNIEKTIPPTLPFTGLGSGSGFFEAQSQKKRKSTSEDCVFFLPDLNMTPSED